MLRLLAPMLALALAVGLILAADKPPPKADFTFINHGDVSTLDLQKMSWLQDLRVGRILFEGLLRDDFITNDDHTLLPGVAERWEISEDGRTYTFHLRAGAKWSNGEPVRAGDFIYAWRRALLPDTAADYTAMFQLIDGGKEFYDWRQAKLDAFKPGDDAEALWSLTKKQFDDLVALKAPDDRTLTFTLRRRVPFFLDLCAFACFYPVYPPLVSQYEQPDPATGRINSRSGWTKPGVLISNGSFALDGWRFKRDMTFKRNPYYWDAKRITFDSMVCLSVQDPSAQILAFRSGGIDWVSDVDAPFRSELLDAKLAFYREHQAEYEALKAKGLDQTTIDRLLPADPRNRVHAFPCFGTYFYSFNCLPKLLDGRDNPFGDKRVRRAFAMAVDKERVASQVRRIGERPSDTLIPRDSIAGYHSPRGLAHDPAEAKRLLTEAGYPCGKGLPTITLLYTRDSGHEFIAQSVKKDWEEILGASVQLEQREIKVFRNDVRNANFMVARGSWYGDFSDPCTFLDINRKDDGNNDRKYDSPRFDALMSQADSEPDPAARMKILEEAERIIDEEDLPILPIFQYVQMYLYDPHRVTGVTSHPRQEQNVQEMDLLGDSKGRNVPKERPAHNPEPRAGEQERKKAGELSRSSTPPLLLSSTSPGAAACSA